MSQQPIDQLRDGLLSATIWHNVNSNGRGWYSITLSRAYKDAKDQWQETNNFSPIELLVINRLSDLAYTKVRELVETEKADKAA